MRLGIAFIFIILFSGCFSETPENTEKSDFTGLVNPLIDTHKSRFDYFASATIPYGMVALSPDTRHGDLWNSGYIYDDNYILNFSHIHNAQTAGIPVMPVTGPCKGNQGLGASKSRFSHEKEIVKPGYHKVVLEDYGITAELTATCRVGMNRYTFPATDEAHVIFDLGAPLGPTKMLYAWARQSGKNEIEGYSVMAPTFRRKKPFMVHFVARFSKPFNDFKGWQKSENGDTTLFVKPKENIVAGEGSGVYVTYKNLQQDESILLKVGISYVSIPNARLNMESELPHWNFNRVVEEANAKWNEYLGRIEVEGGTHEEQVKLYTDLFHTASKRISSDVDGSYADWTGPYPVIRRVPTDEFGIPKWHFMEGDGLWGSQWNLNILWSLIYPEYGNWMAETFLEYYRNAGMMSRCSWGGNYSYVMVGDHTTPLLAALMSTGRATFDPEIAYAASKKNAFPGGIRDRAGYEACTNPSGGGIDWYVDLGYVPVEIANRGSGYHRGGTAMTLEYAYQDWCIATMAKLLGKEADAETIQKRSENWRNVFDPEVGWARPRHESGKWMEGFAPVSQNSRFNAPGFIEGNSATYSFYVPQNISGLIEEMGGRDKFIEKLDSSFIKAQPYRFITPHGEHGTGWVDYENQPSCSMAHLFSHAGAPWKTQYWVNQVKKISYGGTDPYSGYNGDEDQGQLGALGVLMAIGLFNVQGCVGVKPNLEITTPLFRKIVLKFPSTTNSSEYVKFEIVTNKENEEDIYIQNARLNGKLWNSFQFPVSDFLKGGTLELKLGKEPNREWGKKIIFPE
jgi:predicted alpha-1,2-mannosidase